MKNFSPTAPCTVPGAASSLHSPALGTPPDPQPGPPFRGPPAVCTAQRWARPQTHSRGRPRTPALPVPQKPVFPSPTAPPPPVGRRTQRNFWPDTAPVSWIYHRRHPRPLSAEERRGIFGRTQPRCHGFLSSGNFCTAPAGHPLPCAGCTGCCAPPGTLAGAGPLRVKPTRFLFRFCPKTRRPLALSKLILKNFRSTGCNLALLPFFW